MGPPTRPIIVPEDPGPEGVEKLLQARVLKVFDGDGFLADVWNPIRGAWVARVPFRLAFIDAPEMAQTFGIEAKQALHRLIAGKPLRLAPVLKESTGYMPIDPYKRMLCVAYLTEEMPAGETAYYFDRACHVGVAKRPRSVTRNIELEMIVNGWAWVVERYAFEREDDYFAAQADAQRARRGMWALDDPEPPWNFKRRQKRRRSGSNQPEGLFTERCLADGCDGRLVERSGKRGPFMGCSNFPRCRFSRSLDADA